MLVALILAAFSIPTTTSVKAQCTILFDVVPCSGFVLGQEENAFGQFTGSEEWSAIGRAPFPAPTGDFPYGVRLQRNTTTSLYQIERRAGGGQVDVTMAFGATIPATGPAPALNNRMNFNYILQNQSVGPPTVRSFDIMTMTTSNAKIVSVGGLGILCLPGVNTSPCFGRVGIENQNPSYTLDVNGLTRASGYLTVSDAAYKDNISTIENGLEVIKNLRGTTYNLKNETIGEIQFDGGKHSGFIAQEIEKDIPHIVFTDDQGYKSVNYTEIIPYLVEGVKEIADQNEVLKRENEELRNMVEALAAGGNGTNISDKGDAGSSLDQSLRGAELFQNVPNPFDQETRIGYYLPSTTKFAQLLIFDMNGRELRSLQISEMGEGSVMISGNELEAGMYFYSLLADGQEVETKRMILTK